jgi:PAS domain-containing protein
MSETTAGFAQDPHLLALLESFPMGVIAMDGEGRLRASNSASRELLGSWEDVNVFDGGFGDAVRCLHAVLEPEGCGHSAACASCAVFQSARGAVGGDTVHQREARVRVHRDGTVVEKVLLVSAAPFRAAGFEADIRALVVLQDVTELHRLRGLLSICAGCKRIQRDDEAWEELERFIESRSHAMFSHGLCPECVRERHPQLQAVGT